MYRDEYLISVNTVDKYRFIKYMINWQIITFII